MYTHRKVYGHFAKAIGCCALIVHYRRAPEHVHPGPVDDVVASYRWLIDQGVRPQHIALTGDSAGGGLAITTLLRARERGLPMPAATMPLSPWVDMEATGKSMTTKAKTDPVNQRDGLLSNAKRYLGEGDRRAPLVSPLYADLTNLPPLLIQVGESEVLLDDARRLAERAKRYGVDVDLEVWPEMIHVWQLFAAVLPEAQQAIQHIGAFIRTHVP